MNIKKYIGLGFVCLMLCTPLSACSSSKDTHDTTKNKSTGASASNQATTAPDQSDSSKQATGLGVLSQAQSTDTQDKTTSSTTQDKTTSSTTALPQATKATPREGYTCDIAKDRQTFNADKIDRVIGDNYYATQINDMYANFSDFEGKTVELSGYYISQPPYTFVGRKGPSCPYCSNGYVSFEFYGDQDLSSLVDKTSWVDVKGILRKGTDAKGPFYYIEAMSVTPEQEGKGTITN